MLNSPCIGYSLTNWEITSLFGRRIYKSDYPPYCSGNNKINFPVMVKVDEWPSFDLISKNASNLGKNINALISDFKRRFNVPGIKIIEGNSYKFLVQASHEKLTERFRNS